MNRTVSAWLEGNISNTELLPTIDEWIDTTIAQLWLSPVAKGISGRILVVAAGQSKQLLRRAVIDGPSGLRAAAGGFMGHGSRRIIEDVLAWRPWMQAIHSLPKAADEQRIPLVHLALSDDSEPVGFEWHGPRGRCIRLEPRSDGTHAVFLLGVGPSEDAILLADGQPLPLSEPRGGEWARIETDRVMELVKGGNKLELGIRPMIAQASLGRLSLRERWLPRVKMAAIILISVGVGVLIAKMTPMAKPAPLRSSTPDQIASAVQRFLSADENARPIYQRFDAGSGSSLFALMASVPGERNVFEFIDADGQARRLQAAMTVPPSVSRWFNQERICSRGPHRIAGAVFCSWYRGFESAKYPRI